MNEVLIKKQQVAGSNISFEIYRIDDGKRLESKQVSLKKLVTERGFHHDCYLKKK